jgi:hypothetical protein
LLVFICCISFIICLFNKPSLPIINPLNANIESHLSLEINTKRNFKLHLSRIFIKVKKFSVGREVPVTLHVCIKTDNPK